MHILKSVYLIAYASGVAGSDPGSAEGPLTLQNSAHLKKLSAAGIDLHWHTLIKSEKNRLSKLQIVIQHCEALAKSVTSLVEEKKFFIVLGGDHTAAIGTWNGVRQAKPNDALGLIWIDAHMDSHTPQTSLTGNFHGMPLAHLLGFGEAKLSHLLSPAPILLPQNVCLIGTRSFEPGEAELLKKLNIRIFYMDEIKLRGIKSVMQDAVAHVTKNTSTYGISLDIDSIDPRDAPGTGVTEPDGIHGQELYQALKILGNDQRLIGAEIVEFDPHHDKNKMTEKLIPQLISAITLGN